MSEMYKVFISYKNTVNGIPTADSEMAKDLYIHLKNAGIFTFFSSTSLAVLGADRYKEIIDEALDESIVLIVVGTSLENIQSSWVKYEWDSFYNDILIGRKKGRMFSYIDKISSHDLPRTLRNLQCFEKEYSSVEDVLKYVSNALDSIDKENRYRNENAYQSVMKRDMDSGGINKLLQFANLISCGDRNGEYINPYISEEMADIIGVSSKGMTPYNTERCLLEGLNPIIFEVFLAQKIARINKPENCAKSFELLHKVINCWTIFLNEQKKVNSYWIFIALNEEAYSRIQTGEIDEKDISIEDVRFIDMPGRYKGYLLLSGTIEECRTRNVVNTLYSSWLSSLERYAEEGIFFDEIASMVGSVAGNSSLKNIGMKYYAEYTSGGKMYKYDMRQIDNISYLSKNYPHMVELYKKEYNK